MSPKRARIVSASSARLGAAALLAAALTLLAASPAGAQEIGEREFIDQNSGPGVSARPSVHFPSQGSTGFAIDANATYGIPMAPFVIAPGGRFAAYVGENGAVSGMPMAEAMLPFGGIVPYLKAGLGIGHASGPNETSVAVMGGGGVDVHITRDVLVGVDATYEAIPGTGFNTLAIGPRAGLRY